MPYYDSRPVSPDRHRSQRRDRHGRGSRDASPDYHTRVKPSEAYYSTRYTYAPSGSVLSAGSNFDSRPRAKSRSTSIRLQQHAPNTHARRTWPPSPACEDEKSSLAKEANPPESLDTADVEVCSRGSVDQTPIIQDAFLTDAQYSDDEDLEAALCKPNRKVDHSSKNSSFGNLGTDDLSSETRPRQSRRTKAELEVPELRDFKRRAPSPYVYTPKTDSGYFSTAPSAPKAAERRKDSYLSEKDAKPDTLRGSGRPRSSTTNVLDVPSQSATDEDDGGQFAAEIQTGRRPSRYSFVKSDRKDAAELRNSVKESAAPATTATPPASSYSPPPTSSISTSTTTSNNTNSKLEPPPRLSELKADYFSDAQRANVDSRQFGVRPSSPNTQAQASSPPRSPRPPPSQLKSDSPRSRPSSRAGSISGSLPSSPIPASSSPRGDEGVRRTSTFPISNEDRSQRTSRLIPSYTPSSPKERNTTSFFSSTNSKPASSLPYPEDEVLVMPSEEDHRYNPASALAMGASAAMAANSFTVSSSASTKQHTQERKTRPGSLAIQSRPSLASRRTMDDNFSAGTHQPVTPSTASSIERALTSTSAARASSSIWSKPLPPCPRARLSRTQEVWYTLEGCSDFDICSTCFDSNFASGRHRNMFHRAPLRNQSEKVMCDFGQNWMRLAWLITHQQRRHDLNFIYDIMRINNNEQPCPGAYSEARQWYTLHDLRGHPIEGFTVCQCDVRKIEAIMPRLRGAFVKSAVAGKKRKCDMRTEGARFREYIDILVEADDVADLDHRPPDMSRFIEVAQQTAQTRECTRDDLIPDLGWHFIPLLREFTVCEECYSTVVWPAIADGSQVAGRFNKTPLLVHENHFQEEYRKSSSGNIKIPPGSSCQLYSQRMRKVFAKAVQSDDYGYLARRAKERKNMEMRLQAEFAKLRMQEEELKRAGGSSSSTSSRVSQIHKNMEKVSDEWRDWE